MKQTHDAKQEPSDALSAAFLNLARPVLVHKEKLVAAQAEIDKIQAAITERQQLVAKAKETIPAIPDRARERNAIMADIALGISGNDALRSIDELIDDEARAARDASGNVAQVIAENQAIIDGLSQRLAAAQKSFQDIAAEIDSVAKRYYLGMAEVVAAEYVKHAEVLKALHLRLSGLGLCLGKFGVQGITAFSKSIQIPKFNLPQFDGVDSFPPNERGMMLNGDFYNYGDFFRKSANAEEDQFNSMLLH